MYESVTTIEKNWLSDDTTITLNNTRLAMPSHDDSSSAAWDLADDIVRLNINSVPSESEDDVPTKSALPSHFPLETPTSSRSSPHDDDHILVTHSRGSSADTTASSSQGSVLSSSIHFASANSELKERPHSFSGGLSTVELRRLQEAGDDDVDHALRAGQQQSQQRDDKADNTLSYPSLANQQAQPRPAFWQRGPMKDDLQIDYQLQQRNFNPLLQGNNQGPPVAAPLGTARPHHNVPNSFRQPRPFPQQQVMPSPTTLAFTPAGHQASLSVGTPQQLYDAMPSDLPGISRAQQQQLYNRSHHHSASDPAGGPRDTLLSSDNGMSVSGGVGGLSAFGTPGIFPTPAMALYPNQYLAAARLQQQYTGPQGFPAGGQYAGQQGFAAQQGFPAQGQYASQQPFTGPQFSPPHTQAFAIQQQFTGAAQQQFPGTAQQFVGPVQQQQYGVQQQYTGPQQPFAAQQPYSATVQRQQSYKPSSGSDDTNSHSGQNGPSANNRKLGLYKTELCRSWEEKGTCRYGGKCQFAHGEEELRTVQRHPKYKTEICRTFWVSGSCPYGKRCCFIHTEVPQNGSTGPGSASGDSAPPANRDRSGSNARDLRAQNRDRSGSTASDADAAPVSLLARIKRDGNNASTEQSQPGVNQGGQANGFTYGGRPGTLRLDTSGVLRSEAVKQNKSAYPTYANNANPFANNGVLMPTPERHNNKSPGPVTAGPDLGRHNNSRLEIVGYQGGHRHTPSNSSNMRHSINSESDMNFSPSPPVSSGPPPSSGHQYTLSAVDGSTASKGRINGHVRTGSTQTIGTGGVGVSGHVRAGSTGNWGTAVGQRSGSRGGHYPSASSPGVELSSSPWATADLAVGSTKLSDGSAKLNENTWA